MKQFSATIDIAASPRTVWPLLTDVKSYPTWDSGVLGVEGAVAVGNTLKLTSEVNPKRAFTLTVAEIQDGRLMRWRSGMPLGLFSGERTYRLDPLDGVRCRFTMTEVFSGPLAPLITRAIPDLQPSFDQFARGLKVQAETNERQQ